MELSESKQSKNQLLEHLLKKFGISNEEFTQHREFYNNYFNEYNNEIYDKITTRLVHLANYNEEHNWFNQRFSLLWNKLENHDEIIDFGYALPYIHLHSPQLDNITMPHYIGIDKFESAKIVSQEILKYLKVNHFEFITGVVEDKNLANKINEMKKSENSLLVAIESLEHLSNPNLFWKFARKINTKKIYITLPIGPKIPSHYLSPHTTQEAKKYLLNFINIDTEDIIKPHRDACGQISKYKFYVCYGNLKS